MRSEGGEVRRSFSRETILANIDRCCRNKYDFFYLPIDQKTNCNLGYGYINMIDLDSVCTMYREVALRENPHLVPWKAVVQHTQRQGVHDLLRKAAEWKRGCEGDVQA